MSQQTEQATTERMGVDPLAVMERAASVAYARYFKDTSNKAAGELYESLRQSRAAVAELVAADKAYDAAKAGKIEADNRITAGDRSDDAFRRQANAHHAYDRAVDRRRAALAPFSETGR